MNIRKLIIEKVDEELSFLKKIKTSGDQNDFITSHVLPYLFYTNTVDKKYRIIPIFLRKKQDIILLPLFYSLTLFKSYADFYLKLNKFQNSFFNRDNPIRIVDEEGKIGKLVSLDFISQELIISSGMGEQTTYPFQNTQYLEFKNGLFPAYFKKVEEYFEQIKTFQGTFKINENPLELINFLTDQTFNQKNNFSGAVFFTQDLSLLKSDFYRDYKINGQSFFNTIPSSRIDYCMGDPVWSRLGDNRQKRGQQINKVKEFLAFTHLENHDCFLEIKTKKEWFNTLIFDFTKDIKLFEGVLNSIEKKYEGPLKQGEIKDIYLIFNEKDLSAYQTILKRNICNTPFVLNAEQKGELLMDKKLQLPHLIECDISDLIPEFKSAISIAREFCSQVHLINLLDKVLKPLFDTRSRFHSFFDPMKFDLFLNEFVLEIKNIQKDWFHSSEYSNKINTLLKLVLKIKENLNRSKNHYIEKLQLNKDLSTCIVSNNKNIEDQEYLQRNFGLLDVTFVSVKELKNPFEDLEKFNQVIIVNSNRDLNYICNLNLFPNNIYLLLNPNEVYYYKLIKDSSLIKRITHEQKIAEVLNLEYDDKIIDKTKIIIDEEEIEPSDFKLDDFINRVLKENNTNRLYGKYKRELKESIILVFNDDTTLTVNETKYFFIHKENITSLKECHVQAKDLEINDIVFILNHDNEEFDKLIWQVAEGYPEIMELLELDQMWRKRIKEYIKIHYLTYDSFRQELADNDYSIHSNQAIVTWINGDVYQPRKLNKLIDALCELGVISEGKGETVQKAIKTIKKLKTRLPHELQKRHIADLNDLDYESDYEFPELSEKMYQFMDIKTVSLIIK